MNFIENIYSAAQSEQKRSGVLASVTIAQAILESNWGKSAPRFNLFGIKWSSGCGRDVQLLNTHEYVNRKRISVKDKFRAYNNYGESIKDHTDLLLKDRYKPVRAGKTYQEQCRQLQKCGYATDPNYPQKLIKIIEDNKLSKYDSANKSTTSLIKIGSKGKDVEQIQKKLRIITDGIFGKETEHEVKEFQKENGLAVDGVVGPNTLAKLKNVSDTPKTVKRGDSGNDVKLLQRKLGFRQPYINGVFGYKTEEAVNYYQKTHGLVVDGIVGPKTWSKLGY